MERWLSRLWLRNFRCFDEVILEPVRGLNFFLGPNAAGKTSLLEAICVLLRLQSPKAGASLSRCARIGTEGFGIEGVVQAGGEPPVARHLGLRVDAGGRKLRLDDVVQSTAADYLQLSRVTWFGNEDLGLVRGPGAERRHFFDFLGAQLVPGYLRALRAYERAVRSRNLLLREGRDRREIDALTAPLAQAGDFLSAARLRLLPALHPHFVEAVRWISGGMEEAEIVAHPGTPGNSLAEALDASRAQEERLRQTVVGPHRDDWGLRIGGMSAAEYASEGQQRTLALALKLAQSRLIEQETGAPPILLLDDIFGELDAERRERLLARLPKGSQKFITTTFLDWWHGMEGEQEIRRWELPFARA